MAQVDPGGGKKSSRTQLIVTIVGVLAAGLLYWQFVYSSMSEEHDKEERTFKKLTKDNKDLKEEQRIQSAMLECQDDLEALNRQNELMLPEDSEPVAFLKVLTNMAGTAGLSQGPTKKLPESNVSPPPEPAKAAAATSDKAKGKGKGKGKGKKAKGKGDEATAAVETAAAAEDAPRPCWEKVPGLKADQAGKLTFVRVPFEIQVRGTFYQLTRYFWMVHEHAKAGRIITIENLSLEDPKGSPDGVLLTAKFVAVGFREGDKPKAAGAAADAATDAGNSVREATRNAGQPDAAGAGAGGASGDSAGAAAGAAGASGAGAASAGAATGSAAEPQGTGSTTKPGTP